MKNLKEDKSGIFGLHFGNNIMASFGVMILTVLSICISFDNYHILESITGGFCNCMISISPFLVCFCVALILTNWWLDFRVLLGISAVATIAYIILFYLPWIQRGGINVF